MNFVRDHIKAKTLVLEYTDTTSQTADIFTKGLSRGKFLKHKYTLILYQKMAMTRLGGTVERAISTNTLLFKYRAKTVSQNISCITFFFRKHLPLLCLISSHFCAYVLAKLALLIITI